MKRLVFIVEGDSELRFVKEVLGPYFHSLGLYNGIQLHEFEALVFSSLNGFEEVFERSEMDYKGLKEVISGYPNPEEIDNSPDTAPAARLKALIPGYNKVLNGVSIIKETGIGTVLERCPHFRAWVEKLKQAVK